MKKCILIFGIGHSGTGAISGMIHKIGVDGGKNIINTSNSLHPKGIYENNSFFILNEEILKYIDKFKKFPFPPDIKNNNYIEKFSNKLKTTIKKEFTKDVFFIKDPRLCFLFPIYKKILNELNIEIKIIIMERDINELFKSWSRFSFIKSKEIFIKIIDKYLKELNNIKNNEECLEVKFDNLLDKKEEELKRIMEFLNLDSNNIKEALNFVDSKIPKNRRRDG